MAGIEGDPLVKVGIAGALEKELQGDHATFVQFLASAFERAFPNQTELKFEGGFLAKKRLAGLSIRLGDDAYALIKPRNGPLQANRTHVVRGIALKTEPLTVDEWMREVSIRLETQVAQDQDARSALAAALGLS